MMLFFAEANAYVTFAVAYDYRNAESHISSAFNGLRYTSDAHDSFAQLQL